MRVLYSFGDFKKWGEIPDDKVGKPIYLMHPMGQQNLADAMHIVESLKKMEFEFWHRLDGDLVEYRYVGES